MVAIGNGVSSSSNRNKNKWNVIDVQCVSFEQEIIDIFSAMQIRDFIDFPDNIFKATYYESV